MCYLIEFKMLQKNIFCIWYSDEMDGFIFREGLIVSFLSADEAKQYALSENIILDEQITIYNIDALICWVESNNNAVDCHLILNAWNIFIDIASSASFMFLGNKKLKRINNIYNKLFIGNNVLIDEEANKYYPKWTAQEIYNIKQILKNGVNMLMNLI